MRVLIVDDDLFILELMEEALAVNGYTDVTRAEGGQQAVDIVAANDRPFDAVLLDIQMPNMDGIEVCQHLRRLPNYVHVPILMVTAMNEKTYVEAAFRAGASDYVNKPFDPFEIGVRLRNAVSLFEARRRAATSTNRSGSTNVFFSSDDLTELSAMENYAQQLDRLTVEHTFAAFRISNFSDLRSKISSDRMNHLLQSFISVFKRQFEESKSLLSYAADGTFVCLIEGGTVRLDPFLRSSLQDMLNIADWRSDRPDLSVQLRMSEPFRCRKYREVDAAMCIRNSLESVASDAPQVSLQAYPGIRTPSRLTATIGD